MDEQAVFYMRSRGIGEIDARNMLVRAFAGEVLEPIADEALRGVLDREIGKRLDARETP
jgi:Fe-S cluster assembly protein SufD